jgi:hypothetical protein
MDNTKPDHKLILPNKTAKIHYTASCPLVCHKVPVLGSDFPWRRYPMLGWNGVLLLKLTKY